jgi:hypothetical protein
MAGEYDANRGQVYSGNLKVKDIEEKQNVMRDRLLLIGQNLIETKEESSEKILEIKKEIESIKRDVISIKSFLETISNEISKFARKDDLEILRKQAKMFQPLEFVRKSELKNFNMS